MTDPWAIPNENNSGIVVQNHGIIETITSTGFEDNFISEKGNETHPALPDSKEYLEILERKLFKIKGDSNVLRQLSEKREDCLRQLLENSLNIDREVDFALNTPLNSGETAVHELYRHIQPVQALNVGEIVHILKHDQLEEQNILNQEATGSEPASR